MSVRSQHASKSTLSVSQVQTCKFELASTCAKELTSDFVPLDKLWIIRKNSFSSAPTISLLLSTATATTTPMRRCRRKQPVAQVAHSTARLRLPVERFVAVAGTLFEALKVFCSSFDTRQLGSAMQISQSNNVSHTSSMELNRARVERSHWIRLASLLRSSHNLKYGSRLIVSIKWVLSLIKYC